MYSNTKPVEHSQILSPYAIPGVRVSRKNKPKYFKTIERIKEVACNYYKINPLAISKYLTRETRFVSCRYAIMFITTQKTSFTDTFISDHLGYSDHTPPGDAKRRYYADSKFRSEVDEIISKL